MRIGTLGGAVCCDAEGRERLAVCGAAAEPSARRPVDRRRIFSRQMNKTGGVPFYLEDLQMPIWRKMHFCPCRR